MATDTVLLEAKVGPLTPGGDGVTQQQLRTCKTGELAIAQAHAKYYEAVSRGKVYMASNQAEVTFGTALTGTGVTFHLTNPIGSPVNLCVLHASATIRTGSTAGHLVYAANVNKAAAAVTQGTPLTVQNALLGGAAGYGLAASAATLPAAPVAIRSLAGVLTAAGVIQIFDQVDGVIVLAPGTALSIQGITVVGTGIISMCWEEVPIAV